MADAFKVFKYDTDVPGVFTLVDLTAGIISGLPPTRLMRETTLAADTLTASDGGIVVKTSPAVITLDAYSAAQAGNQYGLKNAASANVTIAASAGELLDGATTYTLTPGEALTIIRNATSTSNWVIQ